jgi:hypothetical protein
MHLLDTDVVLPWHRSRWRKLIQQVDQA